LFSLAIIGLLIASRKKEEMPHKIQKTESISIDDEKLREFGRIIGQAIAEQLINHEVLFGDSFSGTKRTGETFVGRPGVPDIDSSIIDVGTSTEGIEAKYESLASEEIKQDDGFEKTRDKLRNIKKRSS
jgi:hypothetical protein